MPRGRQPLLKIDGTAISEHELVEMESLLRQGFTYAEIGERFGLTSRQVRGQNYWRFQIDPIPAFKTRIQRDGLPNRLRVDDAFGYWFAGLFDGEGHLGFHLSPTRSHQIILRAVVLMRADNNEALHYIQSKLGIGALYLNRTYSYKNRPGARPRSIWQVHSVVDLGEVIVPLFERYSLLTKKQREFPLWREAVALVYANTLGGQSNRALRDGFRVEEWRQLEMIERELKHLKHWMPSMSSEEERE
jgi:LAGLIDADG DNA endonuclease family protein